MGLFQSAAFTTVREEDKDHEWQRDGRPQKSQTQVLAAGTLPNWRWVRAIIQGADTRSPRWRHLLVFAGLLTGFEGRDHALIPTSTRRLLGNALVKATNLALDDLDASEELGHHSIALVLSYSFEILSDMEKSRIHHDVSVFRPECDCPTLMWCSDSYPSSSALPFSLGKGTERGIS